MEKKIIQTVKRPLVSKTKSTQTTESSTNLQEQLRSKDIKIEELEKEIKKLRFLVKKSSERRNKSIDLTQVNEEISSDSDVSSNFRNRILFSSNDYNNSNGIRDLNTKKPLDTANIEEIDNYMSKDMSLAISSDPPNVSTRFFVKNPRKKPLPPMNTKSAIVKYPKVSLKSKSKMQKNTSIISDLLYQDDQDKDS